MQCSKSKPFIELLRVSQRDQKPPHPWTSALRTVRAQVGHDGVARIATDAVFEQLDIPRLQRTPEAAKRLKGLMVELGWVPVRSRHVTSRGRASRVRGYARVRKLSQQKTSEDDDTIAASDQYVAINSS